MAEKTFSTLVSEVLAAYPQMIASKNEVEKAKNEVLGAKADLESTKNEVLNTKSTISNELNSTKSEISSQLNTAKSDIASALNTAQKASSDATTHATSAKNYADLAKISQQNANNSVLAANEAKLKALEAQTKSEVYFREASSINARFKMVAKDANSTLKTTAINVAQALGNTTDFQLGRMEFKRRQVNSKIDEANEIIAKLEDNSAVGEIKRALRENVWDHAILQCGMMDIMLSKAVMMFLTLETKDIKEQTALIAREVELDRLDIQRQKQSIYTLNEQAKNLVKALEAKVAI
ncbi:MAG: hypothetical protein MSA33_09625 [Campylobacter sp.]|uniref:hypothetical protein n=1 Tax=Campylobacter sp. TaxID=205 RepID=UPI002AA8FDEA|nr:hypothetical protein [Campylobacter sp.]MCI7550681.1 hypothetical protein [Campylobacter sp.]